MAESLPPIVLTVQAPANGGTRVTLTHDGWAEAGLDEAARIDHEAYWGSYLEDLTAILSGAE